VSPAWRRLAVSRLVFAQRAHLVGQLAARGIDAHCVIVADDENLDLARQHGFATVEMDNTFLGAKVNAGMRYACVEGGATHVVAVGSDDWVHPSYFRHLPEPPFLQTRRRIALLDLPSGELAVAEHPREQGIIPWIIPSEMLAPCGFQPIPPEKARGMDAWLIRGIQGWHRYERRPSRRQPLHWVNHDPHELAAVDFKSETNITPYANLARNPFIIERDQDPWARLRAYYPDELVDQAYALHLAKKEGR
jgi:hypothetical protein